MIEVEMVKRHGATQYQVKYTKLKENNNDIYRLAKLFNTSYSTERIPEERGNADICIIIILYIIQTERGLSEM